MEERAAFTDEATIAERSLVETTDGVGSWTVVRSSSGEPAKEGGEKEEDVYVVYNVL
jgi:hypothetical protein